MGVVYLAEHPVLRRRVAVKLLKRQYLESPSLVTRFVNEARAAAAIHHPNVIEVIDVGMVDDEVPYIMMEFLEGEPLSRRLTRERLGVGKAVDIAIQAARAVSASHAHRDRAPRSQAREPVPGARSDVAGRRARQGARLRHREAAPRLGRQRRPEDAHRRHLRNAGVHVPRAVPRSQRRGRRLDRRLRARLHPVRDVVRARAVHLARVGRRADDAHVRTRSRCRARRTRACRRPSIRSSRPRSPRRRRIGSRACATCTGRSRRRATRWRTRRRRR